MLATVTGAARGLSGHDFRRLLGLWVYALSFRRETLSTLDVPFVAAECFPPRRRCAIEGALLDELLVSTFLAPLLDADLRAATPSPLCDRRQSLRRWCLLDACVFGALDSSLRVFIRERLCSKARSTHPPEFRDSRAAASVVNLPWVESFSYRFQHPQHVNLLELEALIRLIRGPVDRGLGYRRVLCLVDRRVILGSVCNCRSSSRRVNFRLRRLGGLLLANNLSLDLCWIPS